MICIRSNSSKENKIVSEKHNRRKGNGKYKHTMKTTYNSNFMDTNMD